MRRFVFVLIILLAIGFSVGGYFLISNRYKTSPVSSLVPQQTQALASDVNLGGTVSPLTSGFFGPKNNDRGDRVVTVVGQLKRAFLGPGNDFSFELAVVKDGKNYIVSIDLGPKDYETTEYTATATKVTNITSPNAVKVTQQLSGITAQGLFDKYKDKIGQMLAFDIVTEIQTNTPSNCDAQCNARLTLFSTYITNNKLLETSSSIDSSAVLQVGVVSQMTGGSYVL